MNQYDKLRLKKPDETPTPELLKKVLGDVFTTYETFQDEIARFELEQHWQYYNCGCKSWMARGLYCWTTSRGANKEKNIYWLSAWDGYFKVVIWFLEKNRQEILLANVGEETKQKIHDAKTLGKMKTFPLEFDVTNPNQLTDIYTLIKCKKQLEV